jgi:hypothetical protein
MSMEAVAYTLDKGKMFQPPDKWKSTQKQNDSRKNTTGLRKIPPLVTPERLPGRIVREYMPPEDLKVMSGFLESYQRGEVGWDAFRTKIPSELLAKFEAVVLDCRKNGFINPVAVIMPDGRHQIVWSQILSHNRGDQCTMCRNKPCSEREDANGNFKRCWEK